MKRLKRVLGFILTLIWATSIQAVSVKQLYSGILKQDREFMISLPHGYEHSSEAYPLLLVMDGEQHIQHIRQAANILYQSGYPKILIVGVKHQDRSADLTFSSSEEAPSGGNADHFKIFLDTELIPWLTRRYRLTGHHALFGHSAGGLFAAYALSQSPDRLNALILVSPTLRWDEFSLFNKLENALKQKRKLTRIYSAYGNEKSLEKEGFQRWERLINQEHAFVSSESQWFPTEDHYSVSYLGAYYGLKSIYAGFKPNHNVLNGSLAQLQSYYRDVAKEYGTPPVPPQRVLLDKGTAYRDSGEHEQAIATFTLFSELYPDNPLPLIQLATSFEAAGKWHRALSTYNKSRAIMYWPSDLDKRIARVKSILNQ